MDMTDAKLERVLNGMIDERESLLYLKEILHRFKSGKAEYANLEKNIAALKEKLANFEGEALKREQALDERLKGHREQVRAEELAAQQDRMKREKDLSAWQASLAQIEKDHKDNLATWVSRIEGARAEFATITAQIAKAKAQRETIVASLQGA